MCMCFELLSKKTFHFPPPKKIGLADALARYCSCGVLLVLLVRDRRLRLSDILRLPTRCGPVCWEGCVGGLCMLCVGGGVKNKKGTDS